MKKERLETFSDGVFAIVITLLILDIKIPEIDYSNLPNALIKIIPNLISYVLSFFVIGLFWIGHHTTIDKMKKIDGRFLFYNLLLLLMISILPFPTGLLGRFPFQTLTLVLYGTNLLLINFISFLMTRRCITNPHLVEEKYKKEFTKESFRKTNAPMFVGLSIIYFIAIIISFFYPKISYGLDVLVIFIGYIVFIGRMNKSVKEHRL